MRRAAVYVRRCAEWALMHLVFPVVLEGTLEEIEEWCREKDDRRAAMLRARYDHEEGIGK